jgi:hypothetical protein
MEKGSAHLVLDKGLQHTLSWLWYNVSPIKSDDASYGRVIARNRKT